MYYITNINNQNPNSTPLKVENQPINKTIET